MVSNLIPRPKGKVFVNTVETSMPNNMVEVDARSGKKTTLRQSKVNNKCKNTFTVLPSASTGRLKTGLDKLVDNPFYNTEEQIPTSHKDVISHEDKYIKLQYYKEIQWGRPFDFYTDIPVDRHNPEAMKSPTYFQTFVYKLNDGTTIFDRAIEKEDLAVIIMEESKFFANSLKEHREHRWPDAVHYIAHEDEDDEMKFGSRERKNKALGALDYVIDDSETRKKFLKVLVPDIKGEVKDTKVYNELSAFIERNDKQKDGERAITKFLRLLKQIETPQGREKLEAQVLLAKLIESWIVSEKHATYTFVAKDIVIGHNYEQAVLFLMNLEKQEITDEMVKLMKRKLVNELV
jgi:hypothetical protein